MKSKIHAFVIHGLLIGGVVAGNWFGQTELLNIAIWCTWAIIVISFIAVCLPSKDFCKKQQPKSLFMRFLFVTYLFLLVATGWFFTATLYALAWVSLWIKRAVWDEEQKKACAEA